MKEENSSILCNYLDAMKNGEVACMMIEGNDLAIHGMKWKGLQELLSDGQYLAVIGMARRPGYAYFQRYLELTYFHPMGPDQELLVVAFLHWGDLLWNLTILPRAYKDCQGQLHHGHELFEEAAAISEMKLIPHGLPSMNGGGIAVTDETTIITPDPMLGSLGFVSPNLPLEYLYMIENQPGHLVYSDAKAAADKEFEDIARLEAEKL